MNEIRIIVAGSRSFQDYMMLECILDSYVKYAKNPITIVSGTANGADKLGEMYAKSHGYKCEYFPADWNKHGKSAGYIRNREMAQYAVSDNAIGALLAFWDGKSRGTMHMINLAAQHGLVVNVVNFAEGM